MWKGYRSGDLKVVEWMFWGVFFFKSFFSAIAKLFKQIRQSVNSVSVL